MDVSPRVREMTMNKLRVCVLFGGSGFIGTHFARYLLEHEMVEQIYLADIHAPNLQVWPEAWQKLYANGRVRYVPVDVRTPIQHRDLPRQVDLVVNLAAVHREPGHQPHEYFATNMSIPPRLVIGPRPKSVVPRKLPVTKMFPLASTATFFTYSSPVPPNRFDQMWVPSAEYLPMTTS